MKSEQVTINVGGETFVTYVSTFDRYPGTRLYELSRDDCAYDRTNNEYFFDRNPRLFIYILDFYRTGKLSLPRCLCGPVLKKELAFWGITEEHISGCCWPNYREYEEEENRATEIEKMFHPYTSTASCESETYSPNRQYDDRSKRWIACRRKMYLFLEDPRSSFAAKVWSYIYLVVLITSISDVCADSHHSFRVPAASLPKVNLTGITNPKLLMYLTTESHLALIIIDSLCVLFFFIELILRFIVWPNKLQFFIVFFNVIDLLALIPCLVDKVIYAIHPWFWAETNINFSFIFFSVSNVFRAIRILKLVKHNHGLQVIYLTIKASFREILLLLLVMTIAMLVFSTLIYFAELSNEDNFETIPLGFWWAIITMTTVGYGDNVPTTTGGYVVGSCCALAGMLVTGLPIPIIINNFHLYNIYARKKAKNIHQRLSKAFVGQLLKD